MPKTIADLTAEELKETAREAARKVLAEAVSVASKIDDTKIALIGKDIAYIQKDILEIKTDIRTMGGQFVPRSEFEEFKKTDFGNVKKLIYGLVGLTLTAVVGAIMALIIK